MSSENQLKFYFDYISQPSRALLIILKISGKNFKAHSLNLLEGENLSDDYKHKVNRFRKVPAIVDGDFKLAESVAILRYFANKEYISDYIYPTNLYTRARVDEFLSWQHLGIRSSASLYFRFHWVEANVFGTPSEAGKVEKYKLEMEQDLKTLETIWLKDNKFVAGNALTAADVFGACEVEQIRVTGYDVSEKFPKTAAWIEAVRLELQPYFDEAHRVISKYEQETKSKSEL